MFPSCEDCGYDVTRRMIRHRRKTHSPLVQAPLAAAIDRWQLQLGTHRGWEAAGIKLLGKPEMYDILRELEGALINGCDPALLKTAAPRER